MLLPEAMISGTSRGLLSVEEVWDLPLQHPSKANVRDLAQALEREVQATGATKSFVKPETKKDPLTQLRLKSRLALSRSRCRNATPSSKRLSSCQYPRLFGRSLFADVARSLLQ
ncbi:hypothetical protein [Paraburkholderia sp. EG304]|uniref:hypothetical protein n=1 Tax=Paraburkholderia sp. EG304 TaxID=3237015 RepID=UPI00397DF96A